jgi:hypothetical protein
VNALPSAPVPFPVEVIVLSSFSTAWIADHPFPIVSPALSSRAFVRLVTKKRLPDLRALGSGGRYPKLKYRRIKMGRPVGIVILFCLLAQAATTFDLSADFSLRNNPNQAWQYGYSETNSLDPAQFRIDKSTGALGQIGFWHPSVSDRPGPGYYPYVAYNSAKQTRLGSSNGWAARAGEVAMEASNSGQYSLIRFVAPAPGTYKVTARFEGIHFGLSSTDVHVLHNATSLFDAEIEGYGGDPAFHAVEGISPTAAYSGQIDLKANDTVTFACGYGKNKTNFSDTTGLFAQVILLSEVGSRK